MNTTVLALMERSLSSHGLVFERREKFIIVEGGALQIDAEVYESKVTAESASVVLEIHAYSARLGQKPIIETFAGLGNSVDAAVSNAFAKFLMGTFHVLIESLSSHACNQGQGDIERWGSNTGGWSVYSGPLLTQHSFASTLVPSYAGFLERLKATFEATAAPGPHWVRVFLGGYHSQVQASEVLLDNEVWDLAHAQLLAQQWNCSNEYQSIRHFLLMLPHAS